jgi:hypothetical protein
MVKKHASGNIADWKSTLLWAYLGQSKSVEAGAVRTTLETHMPDIQYVLAQGGTAPPDFTLHDAGHGFRVAQRMAEIVPEEVLSGLTAYELALLLMSAYLHDVGMTPARRKVTAHYKYLLTGERSCLTTVEVDAFQKWIDDEGRDVEPPLAKDAPTGDLLNLAEEITAYYCRHRHNDWGAEYTREKLDGVKLGSYDGWLEDLVDLCRSHHDGYLELVGKKFNPRLVGSDGEVVHLRYLACVLRIADVLEVDPERTPEVIFRHRDVGEGSVVYWYKDHQLSVRIQKGEQGEQDNVIIFARPSRAYIHRAVEVTVDQIDDELRLCRAIADETNFEKHLTLELPHRWMLPRAVHRDILPIEGTYEYINGAFRPDTQKLLELLSGVELYGTPLAAVRELLQNAFDAVREQVAYQRLDKANPADPQLEHALGLLHSVELRLESNEQGAWLVCTDTGVGMSKAIITDHLLVSGLARRHDVLDLERRAKRAGFLLGRTGQFGIGVLSYFMLADRIEIRTRRSQEAGSNESNGWYFETRGVGSFGELQQDNLLKKGTEIRLRLNPATMVESPAAWYAALREYVKETLLYTPCCFRLSSRLPGCESLDIKPGWVRTQEDFTNALLKELEKARKRYLNRDTQLEILPAATRRKYEESAQAWEETMSEIAGCVRWHVFMGALPDSLGLYRIGLPHFELPRGKSLGFLRVREEGEELMLRQAGAGHCYVPKVAYSAGWRGMKVDSLKYQSGEERMSVVGQLDSAPLRHISLEIVLMSPEVAKVTVNRNEISVSDKVREAVIWLTQQVEAVRRNFADENRDSAYATLNAHLANGAKLPNDLMWFSTEDRSEGRTAKWSAVNYPIVHGARFNFAAFTASKLLWDGAPVQMVDRIEQIDSDGEFNYLTWNPYDVNPERLLFVDSKALRTRYPSEFSWLWTKRPERDGEQHPIGAVCGFPPAWRDICGANVDEYTAYLDNKTFWNLDNVVVTAVNREGWEWVEDAFSNSLDPLHLKDELFKSKGRLAAWVIRCVSKSSQELWNGLRERDASFLSRLWESLGLITPRRRGHAPRGLYYLKGRSYLSASVLTPEGWEEVGGQKAVLDYLPEPGPEWTLTIVPNDEHEREEASGAASREDDGASRKSGKAKGVRANASRRGAERGSKKVVSKTKKGGAKKRR